MANLERAIQIAHIAHEGEFRRSGDPYVTHPLAVMERASKLGYSTTRLVLAVLHDVPENNKDWPVERIAEEGFDEDVTVPLRLLTKEDGEEYFAYIRRLAEHPDARAVKLLDMGHNLDDDPTPKQVTRYTEAIGYLAAKHAA